MSLEDTRIGSGIVNKQVSQAISDKTTATLVSAVAGKSVKVFRLILSSTATAKFRICSDASNVLLDLASHSDTVIDLQTNNELWPVLQAGKSSDLQIYQSDLTSLDARVYIQYRQE